MKDVATLMEKHNWSNALVFQIKVYLLVFLRRGKNAVSPLKSFSRHHLLSEAPAIAASETELWYKDDNEQNWLLTAGKIENLRIAAKRLNGLEIPANEVFSFWKHIGNPNSRQGFVIGREIREGCLVPTVAGGLCQLSNALYDAALKAHFEIIERHRHSTVIKGSLAEQDRDATVKWNYLDLRFKSSHAFRIEVELTADKLHVVFRGSEVGEHKHPTFAPQPTARLNDCYTCGNVKCFHHPTPTLSSTAPQTATTYLLDAKWSEYEDYVQASISKDDLVIMPWRTNAFFSIPRLEWSITGAKSKTIMATILRRKLASKFRLSQTRPLFAHQLQQDREVARSMAKLIPFHSTHLVVSQNLLPFLAEEGALGGRTFDVLMTRLPLAQLHARLDHAHFLYPHSATLNDFRASDRQVELEKKMLNKAQSIITPHKEIAELFQHKSILLEWKKNYQRYAKGNGILFPASALGRKGAYEVKRIAQELQLTIKVMGTATETPDFWEDVSIEALNGPPLHQIGLVLFPTYVEHQPRLLVQALAAGIPVITTPAAGLPPSPYLTVVPMGDYEALKKAVVRQLTAKPTPELV